MPQLSPLNWILLFILFWMVILMMSVLVWWFNKNFFYGEKTSLISLKENKWNW
uniref:ATP synthase F0 subunit 8 n=1 Tax=Anentome sp. YY-2021 TaxID=2824862 RepID=A0A8A9WPT1_9CAEN|nr:ATP synthase F0 subunit 8 [Anentome sp. YY-2021]